MISTRRVWFAAALAIAAAVTCAATRTDAAAFRRKADPIVITGAKLKSLAGAPIEKIRVFAKIGGKVRPIPFQIDERLPDGRLALNKGPEAKSDPDGGAFDANDELVLMAKDLGARAAKKELPGKPKKAVEIEAADPRDGTKAWAWAAVYDNPPARSDVDYVSISKTGVRVTATDYEVAFGRDAVIGFDYLRIKPTGGGEGKDIFDRLKIRAVAIPQMINVRIEKTENDFTSRVTGWLDGPVRVVRRTENRMMIFWKLPTPASVNDNIFYYNSFEYPTTVSVPFNVGALLKKVEFHVISDHNRNSEGHRFLNVNNPTPVVADGKMSEAEKRLDPSPYVWSVYQGTTKGNTGSSVNRFVYDTDSGIVPKLYYMDDSKHISPPEQEPGMFGAVGYKLENLESLKSGEWRLTSILYNVPEYKPGDEREYLDILDKPLKIVVR